MDRKWYYWCVVPLCTNTSKTAPHKLFIPVPLKPEIRQKWLQLARRKDAAQLSPKSPLYFCEDHFDLPNDMENYIRYKVMGSVKKIQMKPGCLPSRFDCHPDRKRRLQSPTITRSLALKRRRAELIKEAESSLQITDENHVPEQYTDTIVAKADTDNQTNWDNLPTTSDKSDMSVINESVPGQSSTQDKKIQVSMVHPYRSKGIQTTVKIHSKATSPRKNTVDMTTSPLKIKMHIRKPPITTSVPKKLFMQEETTSDSDKLTSSVCDSPPYVASLQSKMSSDYSSFSEADAAVKNEPPLLFLENTVMKIKKRPRFYIGIPERCYFLIDILSKHTKIPVEHILICLKKIRLDTKFTELADEFDMSLPKVSKIFTKNVPIIAKSLKSFILKLDSGDTKNIKKCLPIAFRHNYNKVSSIIDCFEIEIQKPSKALHQALTWSEYKKGNTIKYLVSSTPDGLVNFISSGYGGRTSDIMLVEDCGFLNELCSGSYILADRGFKNIEQLLRQKGCHLLRPPSVTTDSKLSKKDVHKTKQIASLRIHIERVIRRVREFNMLKPHSVVNSKLVRILDECVIIACALINLQDSIIK